MNDHVRKFRPLALGAVALAALLWSDAPAYAGTASSNMNVSASVSANCTVSAGSLAFGAYDPVSANSSSGSNLTGTASLTVSCTSGSSANITLGQGSHAATGSTDAAPLRQMSDGGSNVLAYAVYQDAGDTTVWGNTSGTGEAYSGTGSSTSVTVYGVVAKGQNVPAGSYSDTVVVTVTF